MIDPNNKERCKRDARIFSYLAPLLIGLGIFGATEEWHVAIPITIGLYCLIGWANNQLAQFKTTRD